MTRRKCTSGKRIDRFCRIIDRNAHKLGLDVSRYEVARTDPVLVEPLNFRVTLGVFADDKADRTPVDGWAACLADKLAGTVYRRGAIEQRRQERIDNPDRNFDFPDCWRAQDFITVEFTYEGAGA